MRDEYSSHPERTSCLRLMRADHEKASAALEAAKQLPIAPQVLLKAKKGLWNVVCPASIHGSPVAG